VYKGMLLDFPHIVVKRIINCMPEGNSQFLNEVKIINNITQKNLVDGG